MFVESLGKDRPARRIAHPLAPSKASTRASRRALRPGSAASGPFVGDVGCVGRGMLADTVSSARLLLAVAVLGLPAGCSRQPEDAGSCSEARARYAAAFAKADFEPARAAINSIKWYCKAPDTEIAPMRAAVDAKQAEVRKQNEEAAKPAMSASPVASGSASADAEAEAPLDVSPAAMAKVSVACAQLQQLIRERTALGRETNAACLARSDARWARINAIWDKVGGQERFDSRKTRWADRAPWLGETIATPLAQCLTSCTEDDTPHDNSEDDDWGGPGGVLQDCKHASVALSDWAADIKASKP